MVAPRGLHFPQGAGSLGEGVEGCRLSSWQE